MSRSFLMALLALDLLVMGGAGFIVWDRVRKKSEVPSEHSSQVPQSMIPAPSSPTAATAPAQSAAPSTSAAPSAAIATSSATAALQEPSDQGPAPAERAKPAAKGPPRKMLFRYNDVAARRVSIVGDFNQWSPKLMRKDSYGQWSITLSIAPGEYTYNFIVDGRMIRDPNNKRVRQGAQKIPSSLLSVGSGAKGGKK